MSQAHATSSTNADGRAEELTAVRADELSAVDDLSAVRADELTAALGVHADAERAVQERRYLKSDLVHLGVSVPAIRRCVRTLVRSGPSLDHDAVVALATALWDRPAPAVHERRMAAVELLEWHHRLLSIADLPLLERCLREARTWALLDGLAASVIGPLALADRATWDPVVRRWVVDDDRWLRRASLLVHLPGIRADLPDRDQLFACGDVLLEDRDVFVRKALGWVLRELGQRDPDAVVAWLEPRAVRAAGVTVREAVKRLPEHDGARLRAARAAAASADR
jgi:3-methyladenine DNA glycosylase AlkD